MILTATLLLAALSGPNTMHCVITGEAYDKPAETVDYKGIRYGMCCPDCGPTFEASPDKALAKISKKNLLIGVDLFDPVSGARIEAKGDAPSSTYQGVKYQFDNAGEKATFDKSPAKFTAAPEKEVLHCPVEDESVASYDVAGGYVDAGGVRYYVCCSTCLSVLRKNPSDYTAKMAKYVKPAAAEKVKAS